MSNPFSDVTRTSDPGDVAALIAAFAMAAVLHTRVRRTRRLYLPGPEGSGLRTHA